MIPIEPLDLKSKEGQKFRDFYFEGVEKKLYASFAKCYKKDRAKEGERLSAKEELKRRDEFCKTEIAKVKESIKLLVTTYLGVEIEFQDFLLLSAEMHEKFVTAVENDSELFKRQNEKFKKQYQCYHDAYSLLISYHMPNDIKPFNYLLVESLGVNVCPYCNRNYINGRGDMNSKRAGAQLDHFISRSKYKIFSLSINNFVPSCPQCNHIKSKEDFYYSPYLKSNQHLPSFEISAGKKGFIIKSQDIKYSNQKDILKLDELYAIHHIEFQELELRSRIYNDDKIAEIEKVLGVTLPELTVRDFIFGTIHQSEQDKKYSLSKFRREIVEELLEDKRKA